MLGNLIAQFVLELLRALLVDELSSRVRQRLRQMLAMRHSRKYRRIVFEIQRRTRARLLHKMFTEPDKKL